MYNLYHLYFIRK